MKLNLFETGLYEKQCKMRKNRKTQTSNITNFYRKLKLDQTNVNNNQKELLLQESTRVLMVLVQYLYSFNILIILQSLTLQNRILRKKCPRSVDYKEIIRVNKEEIINIFKEAKHNLYLSSYPLNKTIANLNTTFNIRNIYNFRIQDNVVYENDKRFRATEWLNDILGLFYVYLSSLQKYIFFFLD